jgi:hypothetical protein
MKITITGINFNYANGYEAEYTGVNLSFNSSGATFNLSGYIEVTKDQYAATSGDISQLKTLIIQEVQNKLQSEAV